MNQPVSILALLTVASVSELGEAELLASAAGYTIVGREGSGNVEKVEIAEVESPDVGSTASTEVLEQGEESEMVEGNAEEVDKVVLATGEAPADTLGEWACDLRVCIQIS